jgi:hypothetical protein
MSGSIRRRLVAAGATVAIAGTLGRAAMPSPDTLTPAGTQTELLREASQQRHRESETLREKAKLAQEADKRRRLRGQEERRAAEAVLRALRRRLP